MIQEELEIIYQDEELIAINKPVGLLVHRTKLDPGETRFAIQILRDQIGSWVYPVHRLDKGTSGAMLFTKSPESASVIGELILNQRIQKTYLAIVRGYPPDVQSIYYAIHNAHKTSRRLAITHFETLARTELEKEVGIFNTARYSLLKIKPETGRRHQIRKHLKHIFYPIIGDKRYGDRAHNRFFREELGLDQMFLHAAELKFINPYKQQELIITAEFPEHWNEALKNFPPGSIFNSASGACFSDQAK